MNKKLIAILILFTCLSQANLVLAHSQGASLEKTADDYLIDVGYEPEEVVENEQVVFDFNLLDQQKLPVEYDLVWVRVSQGDKTHLATGISKSSLGKTTLLYNFVEKGTYYLDVSFRQQDEEIVTTRFPIEVSSRDKEGVEFPTWIIGVVGGIMGFALSWVLKRR